MRKHKQTKLQRYEDADFIIIQSGEIHWLGYFYNSNGWHMLEYTNFYTKIKDFIEKYNHSAAAVYNEYGYLYNQHIRSEKDDPEIYTEDWFNNEITAWLKNATEIKETEITPDTLNGKYVIIS